MTDLEMNLAMTMEQKVLNFKSDPEKMKDINAFLNDLFEQASIAAGKRQLEGKQKYKYDIIGMQNGTKRIGAWSNRARGFMSRVITAICNCTNSVRNVTSNTNRT